MLVILTGKSGTGKSSVIQKLKNFGFQYAPSYTTRPPREFDDKIHIPEVQFSTMIDEFIEWVIYNGYKYGRKKTDILKAKDENMVVDLEPYGIPRYVQFCIDNSILYVVICLKCPENIRRSRIQTDVARLQRDDDYFEKFCDLFDVIIDTSKFSVDEVASIIQQIVEVKVNGIRGNC